MKKLFLFAVAAFAMLATSCSKDANVVEPSNEEVTVSFMVNAPEMATRTIADGTTATALHYAVYSDGQYLQQLSGVKNDFNLSATLKFKLVDGMTYDFIFWAQNPDGPYNFDRDNKKVTVDYDANNMLSNNEKNDAFFGVLNGVTVNGGMQQSVDLYRPFAQLNIAAADYEEAKKSGINVTKTSVTLKSYTTLDLTDGTVADEVEATYALNNILTEEFASGYKWLSMNYILVDSKELVNVTFNTDDTKVAEKTWANVPVQRNYRTNIVGNILTSDVDVDINVKPGITDTYFYNYDAATRTITINSKEELLGLNELNEKWVELFSNGQGTDYSNYATVNGGKGVDFYYKWGWTIKLNADIDLENITLDAPINLNTWGYFDGQGHTIKNVNIITSTTTENAAALFCAGKDIKSIKNLTLDNVHVKGSHVGNSTAAVLASDCNGGEGVDNITITRSSVWGGKYTGAVVGYGYTSVTNCVVEDTVVEGGYKLGGIIGYVCSSNSEVKQVNGNTLTDCTVEGTGEYADGKSQYVIGKVVGNFNCDGSCLENTIVNMTTPATDNIGKIEAGKIVNQDALYITPANLASVIIESDTNYYLSGDFASQNVYLKMNAGVENVVFDGADATNINELIVLQNGKIIDNSNDVVGSRSGVVAIQNFNVLSQINVFACKTEVVVQDNTAEALMIHAGNCDVKVLRNTIDANFESHPTYRDATNTWNTNNYGIALNIFEYNLWLDGNTVTDAIGHVIGINGWENTIDTGVENKIESFKGNILTVNSTASTKRAAFKVWDDETYASKDEATDVVNATAQAFINAVLADGSNTFNILDGYNHTIFCFYNVNTNN